MTSSQFSGMAEHIGQAGKQLKVLKTGREDQSGRVQAENRQYREKRKKSLLKIGYSC
jgi:hypothetical protein